MPSSPPTLQVESRRVLRVQLAFGFHAEAKADSILLRHLDGSWDGMVFCHEADGYAPAARIAEASGRSVRTFDSGWRDSGGVPRSLPAKLGSLLRLGWAFPQMILEARRLNPDVIDSSQQRWDSAVAAMLSRILRKPHVVHLHYNTQHIGAWARFCLRRSAHVVAVSDFVRDQVLALGVPPERVTTILNAMEPVEDGDPADAIALREELDIPTTAVVVASVGRVTPWKGQIDTLEAFGRIAAQHPEAYLLFAGDGPGLPELKERSAELRLGKRVLLLGHRTDVPRILAAADVFAHPSREDPCPLSLLEALAQAMPCVAYAEGGAVQLIVDGETGLLAPPGDVTALAERLDALLGDASLRRRIGTAARERIRLDFRPGAAGHAYTRVLDRLVDER